MYAAYRFRSDQQCTTSSRPGPLRLIISADKYALTSTSASPVDPSGSKVENMIEAVLAVVSHYLREQPDTGRSG